MHAAATINRQASPRNELILYKSFNSLSHHFRAVGFFEQGRLNQLLCLILTGTGRKHDRPGMNAIDADIGIPLR